MRIAVFSTNPYDQRFLEAANQRLADQSGPAAAHEIMFYETRLSAESVALAFGIPAVCIFVNDEIDAATLSMLSAGETKLVALRCAGFNNVDVGSAAQYGITVARVPAYSPHAVAEHTIGLMLALDRGGQCKGIAFRLKPETLRQSLDQLVRREMSMVPSSFPPRWITVETEEGPLRALTFAMNRKSGRYIGHLSDEETAQMLATACGFRGSMAEYLHATVEHLEELGIHDRHLWKLQHLTAERIGAMHGA